MTKYGVNLITAALFGLAAFAGCAAAAAPFRVGDMEIHPLVDSAGRGSPKGTVVGLSDADADRLVPSGSVERTVLACVVKFPRRTVLFDAGLGVSAGGKLLDALGKIGVSPADIDEIVVTHMHGDHIGGLVDAAGRAAFPGARVNIGRIEQTWWLDRAREFDAYARGGALARGVVNAYPARVAIFEFGEEILPGVTAIDAAGHTPGHTAFRLESGGGAFLVVGDIMHFADIQFAHPGVAVTYDVDQAAATAARARVLKLAAAENLPIMGMHLPVPGLWRVRADGAAFAKAGF